jgi:two-component system phosphate regulon sensor histidine kinase PhoR
LFLAAFSAAILAIAVAGALFAAWMRSQADVRVEAALVTDARLAGELLDGGVLRQGARQAPGRDPEASLSAAELDGEADRIGHLLDARVTFIAADGRVVGDSDEPLEGIGAMENHATRPEVVAAREAGIGRARRYSATLKSDVAYVAVRVQHPGIAFVSVALPLTTSREQLGLILTPTLASLGMALAGSAVIAFLAAGRLGQRVRAVAEVAERYRRGDLTSPRLDYGDDEIGEVARALDESVRELGRRLGELARDRGRMEAILAGMIEGVIVVDPQGRLQLVNDAARQMLKLDDLAIGRHYVEIIRHPAITDLVGAALGEQTPVSVEMSPPRDPSRTLMVRAAPATSGTAHGAIVVLHDITELRRVDQIRRDFVANVSHELRTPLTAIRGYVEVLLEGDTSADEGRRFLEVIERHTLRMERLVKDLLRLARLDAGQETLEIASCDTRALVQAVVADLAPSIEARRQNVDVLVDPGAETIRADPAKLHDVVRNLIANASTYGPEGSVIRVESGNSRGSVVSRVRAVLPGGQVAGARSRRHRPRTRHRQAPGRAPRWHGPYREWRHGRSEIHRRDSVKGRHNPVIARAYNPAA